MKWSSKCTCLVRATWPYQWLRCRLALVAVAPSASPPPAVLLQLL